MCAQGGEVDRPVVDIQAGGGKAPGDVRLGVLGVGAAHARDPDEHRQLVQERVGELGYRIEHLRDLIGHRTTLGQGPADPRGAIRGAIRCATT